MPDKTLTPEDIQGLKELAGKATPLSEHWVINRYEHGGGRVYVQEPNGGRHLIADFYHENDRECFIASREAVPALIERNDQLEADNRRLREDVNTWNADARRLSGGLLAIYYCAPDTPLSVIQGTAYDIALNCMDGETATFQIQRRARAAQEASSS